MINMDPANDMLSYDCALDLRNYTTLEEIMTTCNLGPNGGIVFAMEQVNASVEDFISKIKKLGESEYLIFDCPGQVELFTHHSALSQIFQRLQKNIDLRLTVVNLIDSINIASPSQYISVLLLALRSMLQFNLPQINVLSKIDLLAQYEKLPFRLEYYTDVQDLHYIEQYVDEEVGQKYANLTKAIASVVEDFGLVNFQVLAIEDKESVIALLAVIDRANGYTFGSTEIGGDSVWVDATRQGGELATVDIHERWIERKDEYDKLANKDQASDIPEQDRWRDAFKNTMFKK